MSPDEKERERWRIKAAKKRISVNLVIQDIKLRSGCADCGYNTHVEALDFDHTGDKNFGISSGIRKSMSLKKILAEIAKCEVVCANCHRVRTANRRLRRTNDRISQLV